MFEKSSTVALMALTAVAAANPAEAQHQASDLRSYTSSFPEQDHWQHFQSDQIQYRSNPSPLEQLRTPDYFSSTDPILAKTTVPSTDSSAETQSISLGEWMSSGFKVLKGLYQTLEKLDPLIVLGLGVGIGAGAINLKNSLASNWHQGLRKQAFPESLEIKQRVG